LTYYGVRSTSAAKKTCTAQNLGKVSVYFSPTMTFGNLNMGIILAPWKVAHEGGYNRTGKDVYAHSGAKFEYIQYP
jgi:hypothetical protein